MQGCGESDCHLQKAGRGEAGSANSSLVKMCANYASCDGEMRPWLTFLKPSPVAATLNKWSSQDAKDNSHAYPVPAPKTWLPCPLSGIYGWALGFLAPSPVPQWSCSPKVMCPPHPAFSLVSPHWCPLLLVALLPLLQWRHRSSQVSKVAQLEVLEGHSKLLRWRASQFPLPPSHPFLLPSGPDKPRTVGYFCGSY